MSKNLRIFLGSDVSTCASESGNFRGILSLSADLKGAPEKKKKKNSTETCLRMNKRRGKQKNQTVNTLASANLCNEEEVEMEVVLKTILTESWPGKQKNNSSMHA